MRITPRKHEIQRIVDLLEDPTFETAEQLAKAVIKEVADQLQMRDTYALVHTWEDGRKGLNFGAFGSPAEAEAFAKKCSFGGRGKLVPLTSPGVTLAATWGKENWPGYCFTEGCGHPPHMHAIDGASRGKCHLESCPCTKFIKDDPSLKAKKKKPAAKKGGAKGVNEL